MRKYLFISVGLFLLALPALAQNTRIQEEPERTYREARELFTKHHYNAALQAFQRLQTQSNDHSSYQIKAQYYRAVCALRLFHKDGVPQMQEFIQNHPEHPLANRGQVELGKYFYREGDFEKTAQAFDKVYPKGLTKEEKRDIHFKAGYADFNLQNFEDAKTNFDAIKNTSHKYAYAASYYAGYIDYRNGNYKKAVKDLKRAGSHSSFSAVVPYMIANIYYKQEQYDLLLEYAQKVLERDEKVRNRDKIALLAGEAHYKQKNYREAVRFFKEYFKQHAQPEEGIVFRYAYSLYQTGAFEEASGQFKKIAAEEDSLGQQASFYLGNTYLKTGRKQFALRAYENAMTKGKVEEIREEAAFKIGKIHYNNGDYQNAIEAFKHFNQEFSRSPYRKEIQKMLPKAYLNTGNYGEAVSYIEKKIHKSAETKKVYQKVAYYHGAQLYNDKKFKRAVEMFAKSMQYPYDPEVSAAAAYWKGEAFSIGNRFEDAINSYATVFQVNGAEETEYFLKARYGIGYAYYNTKQYKDALRHFREYTEAADPEEDPERYTDALIRLADCRYVTKAYDEAVQTYERALQTGHQKQDYIHFRLGIVASLRNNVSDAHSHFETVLNQYPQSTHYDDALFKKARVDMDQTNYKQAVSAYSRLISERPESPLVPYAYRDRAICYRNLDKTDKALADNKKLLQEYINHEAAKSAVQEIVDLNVPEKEYATLVEKYRKAHPDDEALASVEFEAAKNQYYNQNYQKAINKLRDYLKNYKDNTYTQEAYYYLAEAYNRSGKPDSAAVYYEKVRGGAPTVFRNRSVYSLAEIAYEQERYADAQKYYAELLNIARNAKEVFRGRRGLMRTYYKAGSGDSVITYADKIIEGDYALLNAENQARLYKARVLYDQHKWDKAKDLMLTLINEAKGESGAEANYLLAKIYHEEKAYQKSLQQCYNLNDNFAQFSRWMGKSFLLIADNLNELGETFQAKATLESIIKNSPEEDIVEKAKKKLEAMKEKGEKTPENVKPHEKDTAR